MSLADWARFGSCVLELSGCSKSAVRFAISHLVFLRLRRALVTSTTPPSVNATRQLLFLGRDYVVLMYYQWAVYLIIELAIIAAL
jgi:hypothetical protein